MQRKYSPRTKAVLVFMGFLVLLPFMAEFAAIIPHAGDQPAISAPAHAAAPHAEVPTAHPHVHAVVHLRNKVTVYVVRAGDTLWAIAVHFHVKGGWVNLYHANLHTVGGNPNLIFPGQHLAITQTELT